MDFIIECDGMQTDTLWCFYANKLYKFTDAQPQPDFRSGLTIFLQWSAHALGDPNNLFSSRHLILLSGSKSPVNFWPFKTQEQRT